MNTFLPINQLDIDSNGEQLMEEHQGRRMMFIHNTGTVDARLAVDGMPADADVVSWPLSAGARYEPVNVPGNRFFADCPTGTTTIVFGEG